MRRLLWAFDVGNQCGFACGEIDDRSPQSGSWVLRRASEHRAVGTYNLIKMLNDLWSEEKPLMVVKEAPIEVSGMMRLGNGAHGILTTHILHGHIETMCQAYGVPFENVPAATVRKHFVGFGNLKRDDAKRMALERCHLVGHLPRDCRDLDRAEACAVWDYGAATALSKKKLHGNELYLFGEVARA